MYSEIMSNYDLNHSLPEISSSQQEPVAGHVTHSLINIIMYNIIIIHLCQFNIVQCYSYSYYNSYCEIYQNVFVDIWAVHTSLPLHDHASTIATCTGTQSAAPQLPSSENLPSMVQARLYNPKYLMDIVSQSTISMIKYV